VLIEAGDRPALDFPYAHATGIAGSTGGIDPATGIRGRCAGTDARSVCGSGSDCATARVRVFEFNQEQGA
jgi:hypothetical protein